MLRMFLWRQTAVATTLVTVRMCFQVRCSTPSEVACNLSSQVPPCYRCVNPPNHIQVANPSPCLPCRTINFRLRLDRRSLRRRHGTNRTRWWGENLVKLYRNYRGTTTSALLLFDLVHDTTHPAVSSVDSWDTIWKYPIKVFLRRKYWVRMGNLKMYSMMVGRWP